MIPAPPTEGFLSGGLPVMSIRRVTVRTTRESEKQSKYLVGLMLIPEISRKTQTCGKVKIDGMYFLSTVLRRREVYGYTAKQTE